jgi:hypothetical protein
MKYNLNISAFNLDRYTHKSVASAAGRTNRHNDVVIRKCLKRAGARGLKRNPCETRRAVLARHPSRALADGAIVVLGGPWSPAIRRVSNALTGIRIPDPTVFLARPSDKVGRRGKHLS